MLFRAAQSSKIDRIMMLGCSNNISQFRLLTHVNYYGALWCRAGSIQYLVGVRVSSFRNRLRATPSETTEKQFSYFRVTMKHPSLR
jgi:hypothetical protein